MSEEAKGRNGQIIGTPEYWKQVCGGTILHDSIDFSGWTSSMFQAALRAIGTRASQAIDEIYQDLSDCGSRIRYIPSDDRAALAKQVSELYNVCQMADVTSSHSGDCERALGLSALSPWSNPLRNDRAIEFAMEIVKRQSRLSNSEVLSLLKEAAQHSISFAAGNDEYKTALLESVAPGNDQALLRDVADEFEHEIAAPDDKGRCGYSIGSRAYLSHMEGEVFECGVPILYSAAFGDPNYVGPLKESLQAAADQLEQDLDDAIRENDYITDDTAVRLRAVVDDLNDLGAKTSSLPNKIDALDWFTGGPRDVILQLQRALNELLGNKVEEDGVWGEKTKKFVLDCASIIKQTVEKHYRDRKYSKAINRILDAADKLSALGSEFAVLLEIPKALRDNQKEILRFIWQLGIERYLQPKGCDLAEKLLKHSLSDAPCDRYFSNSSPESRIVLKSKGIQNIITEVSRVMEENPFIEDYNGSSSVNFGDPETYDQDLHLGLGKISVNYTCIRRNSDLLITFTIKDRYDFDEFRLIDIVKDLEIDINTVFGYAANDFAFFSQNNGVITPYYVTFSFQTTIPLPQRRLAR